MSIEKSKLDGELFMSKMKDAEATRLAAMVQNNTLISTDELMARWDVTRDVIEQALHSGTLFTLSVSGEDFYPDFFTDETYKRGYIESVAKALGDIPGTSKYHFFTHKSHRLGSVTPLDALVDGRLEETINVALGFAER